MAMEETAIELDPLAKVCTESIGSGIPSNHRNLPAVCH